MQNISKKVRYRFPFQEVWVRFSTFFLHLKPLKEGNSGNSAENKYEKTKNASV